MSSTISSLDLSEQKNRLKEMVSSNYRHLKKLNQEDQTEDIIRIALLQSWHALEFIKNPSDEHIKYAVGKNAAAFGIVPLERQTEEICLLALRSKDKTKFSIIKRIQKQTEEMCRLAVLKHGMALQYCQFKTEDICLASVSNHSIALQFVPDECKTEKVCYAAFEKSGISAIYFPSNPSLSEDFYLKCIARKPDHIKYFHKEAFTEKVSLTAVRHHWKNLRFINTNVITEDIFMEAYAQSIQSIRFLWKKYGFRSTGLSALDSFPFVDNTVYDDSDFESEAINSFDRERQVAYSLEIEKRKQNNCETPTISKRRYDNF